MERLTLEEIIDHCKRKRELLEKYTRNRYFETAPIENNIVREYWEHKQVAEYLQELLVYRGLEEQGKLLKLPCKIGDTLYCILPDLKDGCLTEKIVAWSIPVKLIALDKNGDFYAFHDEDDYFSFDQWDKIGDKYALPTKEEAEAKLKEIHEKEGKK